MICLPTRPAGMPYSLFLTSPSRRRKSLRCLTAWARGGVGDGDLGEGLLFLVGHRFGDLNCHRIRGGYLHIADFPTRGAHCRYFARRAILRRGVGALHPRHIKCARAACTSAAPLRPGYIRHDRVGRNATWVIIAALRAIDYESCRFGNRAICESAQRAGVRRGAQTHGKNGELGWCFSGRCGQGRRAQQQRGRRHGQHRQDSIHKLILAGLWVDLAQLAEVSIRALATRLTWWHFWCHAFPAIILR